MRKKKKTGVKIDHGVTLTKVEDDALLPRIPSQPVSVGDKVQRKSYILCRSDGEKPRTYSGTVIYVHPKGRFHVVEFNLQNGKTVRESFLGIRM